MLKNISRSIELCVSPLFDCFRLFLFFRVQTQKYWFHNVPPLLVCSPPVELPTKTKHDDSNELNTTQEKSTGTRETFGWVHIVLGNFRTLAQSLPLIFPGIRTGTDRAPDNQPDLGPMALVRCRPGHKQMAWPVLFWCYCPSVRSGALSFSIDPVRK